jgi:hypothetical protein
MIHMHRRIRLWLLNCGIVQIEPAAHQPVNGRRRYQMSPVRYAMVSATLAARRWCRHRQMFRILTRSVSELLEIFGQLYVALFRDFEDEE